MSEAKGKDRIRTYHGLAVVLASESHVMTAIGMISWTIYRTGLFLSGLFFMITIGV